MSETRSTNSAREKFYSISVVALATCLLTGVNGVMWLRAEERRNPSPAPPPKPVVRTKNDRSLTESPPRWDLEDIGKHCPPYGVKGQVYVLAWIIGVRSQERRWESCLAMKVLEKDEYGRYRLSHLFREIDSSVGEWSLSFGHALGGEFGMRGVWIQHHKCFKDKPGNKEIYDSLSFAGVNWDFDLDYTNELVGCGISEKNWLEAIGEKPTRFFGKQQKRK